MNEAVSENGVPLDGKRAAETGWGERDNPFPKGRRDHEAWANAHKAQLGEMWKDWMHVPDELVEAMQPVAPMPDPAPDNLRYFAEAVYERFATDLRQGYTSRDKVYAIELLGKGLGLPTDIKHTPYQGTNRVEEERFIRAGKHLHETAKSLGWKDDGEGAYEYIQRISYEQGLEDAKRGNRE
jgi:hypothetical protein